MNTKFLRAALAVLALLATIGGSIPTEAAQKAPGYRVMVVYRDPLSDFDDDTIEAQLRFRLTYQCQTSVLADAQACAVNIARLGFWSTSVRFTAPAAVVFTEVQSFNSLRSRDSR